MQTGYQCNDSISHEWGQYSPYFSVPSDINSDVPPGCAITFVNLLSRHGARFPSTKKSAAYAQLIQNIHAKARSYGPGYEFIRTYNYTLGAEDLTTFGQQELVNSGTKFFERYLPLTGAVTPFFRASSSPRVVMSAQNFTQGYHQARLATEHFDPAAYPYQIEVIQEGSGNANNTLDHDLCTNFENGPDSNIASDAQKKWRNVFTPPIVTRVNNNLPGASLSASDIISLMELCPFNTVASPNGTLSQFCSLFSTDEWQSYNYYGALNKYYGYGNGNPLGPTQGAGWASELIARLTSNRTYVQDAGSYTSINHTLDNSAATFPLGRTVPLYADFSHDDDLTSAFSVLGLYNMTAPLSNTTRESEQQTNGYSAAWTVPFSARAYFEKMVCPGSPEELVRVVINDRVVPFENCGADALGRCTLSRFVESQTFPTSGADWAQCFS